MRRTAAVALGALLILRPAGANGRVEAAAAPDRPPDIVLIVTDDQRGQGAPIQADLNATVQLAAAK